MRIALRDINKKGIEIGERQNRCHDDSLKPCESKKWPLAVNYTHNQYNQLLCSYHTVVQNKHALNRAQTFIKSTTYKNGYGRNKKMHNRKFTSAATKTTCRGIRMIELF